MRASEAGFTLMDMLVTVGIIGVLAGAAVPELVDVAAQLRLSEGQRDVESVLQAARLKAVTAGHPMRVRFNCPVAGEYRMVELIGTPANPDPADSSNTRCSTASYPYPAGDNDPLTRPNNDGPVRYLPDGVSFQTSVTLEFWADGTVHKQVNGENPWSMLDTTGADISLTRKSVVKHISVNGLGKITLVQ